MNGGEFWHYRDFENLAIIVQIGENRVEKSTRLLNGLAHGVLVKKIMKKTHPAI